MSYIDENAVMLNTRIPEEGTVQGLEYGAHVSRPNEGWSGYYVRPAGTERWGVARLTPASDEVYDTDEEIVDAIAEEIANTPA